MWGYTPKRQRNPLHELGARLAIVVSGPNDLCFSVPRASGESLPRSPIESERLSSGAAFGKGSVDREEIFPRFVCCTSLIHYLGGLVHEPLHSVQLLMLEFAAVQVPRNNLEIIVCQLGFP